MKIFKDWKYWLTFLFIIIGTIIAYLAWQNPKQNNNETYNIKTENQFGGVTAGKIENFILTDKESLGIKDPLGLYKDNKKIGIVTNPIINEGDMTFSFDKINLDKSFEYEYLFNYILETFEYKKYILKPTSIESFSGSPQTIKKVSGIIVDIVE